MENPLMESENESRIYRKRYFYVLFAFCLIVYLTVYKQYWTVQSAERAILEQWAEVPYLGESNAKKIVKSVKRRSGLLARLMLSEKLDMDKEWPFAYRNYSGMEEARKAGEYGRLYSMAMLPYGTFLYSSYDWENEYKREGFYKTNKVLRLYVSAYKEEMIQGCMEAMQDISEYNLNYQQAVAKLTPYFIEEYSLDESYTEALKTAQKEYASAEYLERKAEKQRQEEARKAQAEKEKHWRTSADVPKVGMKSGDIHTTALGRGTLESSTKSSCNHTTHTTDYYYWYKNNELVYAVTVYDGVVTRASDYRSTDWEKAKQEAQKAEAKARATMKQNVSFDPDDYDIEGYYEDNRDLFDNYEDAYDAFLDDPDEWDQYR